MFHAYIFKGAFPGVGGFVYMCVWGLGAMEDGRASYSP